MMSARPRPPTLLEAHARIVTLEGEVDRRDSVVAQLAACDQMQDARLGLNRSRERFRDG